MFRKQIDVPLYTSGIFGVILVLDDAVQARGADPEPAHAKAEFHEGVHDEPLYDVTRRRSVADLLIAQGVRKEFGGLVAVNDVDFTIPERTIVSLIGPNGAGQDDVLQHADRRLQADRGPDRLRR